MISLQRFFLISFSCFTTACGVTSDKSTANATVNEVLIATSPVKSYDAAETKGVFRQNGRCLRLLLEDQGQYTPVFSRRVRLSERTSSANNELALGMDVTIGGSPMNEKLVANSVDPVIASECGGPYFFIGSYTTQIMNNPPVPPAGPSG